MENRFMRLPKFCLKLALSLSMALNGSLRIFAEEAETGQEENTEKVMIEEDHSDYSEYTEEETVSETENKEYEVSEPVIESEDGEGSAEEIHEPEEVFETIEEQAEDNISEESETAEKDTEETEPAEEEPVSVPEETELPEDAEENVSENEIEETAELGTLLSSESDFKYTVSGSTVTITKYVGTEAVVVIPETIEGNPVTVIGNNAFENCRNITSITLPSTIRTLGVHVFSGTTFTSITIPKSLTTSQASSFGGGGPFYNSSVKEVIFESGMTTIPGNVMKGASKLETVSIPDSVTKINEKAFLDCVSLRNPVLPEGLETIGNSAFENCRNITGITLPSTIRTLGEHVFCGTTFTSITIPKSLTTSQASSFGGGGPFYNSSVKEAVFESGMTTIPGNVMKGASKLETVSIPESVTKINENAFIDCVSLRSPVLPEGLETIGNSAFENCGNITSITLPSTIRTLGVHVFSGTTFTSITIPKSLTTSQASSFGGGGPFYNSSVKEVIFESGMTTIPGNVMKGASKLETVSIPDSVTKINEKAFLDCVSLRNPVLPEGLETIGNSAFENCRNITGITLPSTIRTLGEHVFCGTTFTSITIPKSLTTSQASSFGGGGPFYNSSVKEAVFESGMTTIPGNVMKGASKLETVSIPESVTEIGSKAFDSCTSLRSVLIPSGVKSISGDAFSGTRDLTLYCNYDSYGVIYAIDKQITFASSEDIPVLKTVIDRNNTDYYMNLNSAGVNGKIPCTVQYSIRDDIRGKLSGRRIVVYIPQGTEIAAGSVQLNKEQLTDYSFNESTRKAVFNVSQDEGVLYFYLELTGTNRVLTYAYLEGKINGTWNLDVIGAYDETFKGLSIHANEFANTADVEVKGIGPSSGRIDLYVDGVLNKSTTADKSGCWSSTVTLSSLKENKQYIIKAVSALDGEEISAQTKVMYSAQAPVVTSFELIYAEHEEMKLADLLDDEELKKPVYFLPGRQMDFEVGFNSNVTIDRVYITSTRGGDVKKLEAVYDSSTNTYKTDGFFDPKNHYYVPGKIGIEYTTYPSDLIPTREDVNHYLSEITQILNAYSDRVNYSEKEENKLTATLTVKDYLEHNLDLIVETQDYADVENIKEYYGITKDLADIMELVGRDEDGNYLWTGFTTKDSGEQMYIIFKTTEPVIDIVDTVVTMTVDNMDINASSYDLWYTASEKMGMVAPVVECMYKYTKIQKETRDLINDINQSGDLTLDQKEQARKAALNLESDRMHFLVITMTMGMLVAGTVFPAAGVAFAAMMLMLNFSADQIFAMRSNRIKAGEFNIKLVMDPSGYVYDEATVERLEGVTTTAYWIEYDPETDWDEFLAAKPAEEEYGTVWNANEYNQVNPLMTDYEGRYQWDVPEGWWRVKYEKEGYLTTWSEWLPVPPPQLEVNIGMQSENPQVIPVKEVSLDIKEATLNKGDSLQLTAEIIPEGAENRKVHWSSSAPEIVSVDDRGQVKALAPGVAYIKAVSDENSAIEDICKIRVQFTDVTDPTQFYYEYIYDMVDKGITTGYPDGTFRPTANCNRAAVVTFLWRLKGKPDPTKMATFKDMTGSSDFDKAISWAAESGITTGWDDNTFRPWNTCNRAAVLTFLWRAAGEPEPTQTASFKDMTGNSDFDKAISWGVENGITTGWADNTFRPWNTCNRLAVVSFLGRYDALNK